MKRALATVVLGALSCNTPKDAADARTAPEPANVAPVATPAPTASGEPAPCGPTTCKPGEICCNASCGICTPPDGMCTQQVCDPPKDAAPSASPSSSAPTPPAAAGCASDADCATYSSYCKEAPCFCLPVTRGAAPACKTSGNVSCLVDPCRKKSARCRQGRCTVVDAP